MGSSTVARALCLPPECCVKVRESYTRAHDAALSSRSKQRHGVAPADRNTAQLRPQWRFTSCERSFWRRTWHCRAANTTIAQPKIGRLAQAVHQSCYHKDGRSQSQIAMPAAELTGFWAKCKHRMAHPLGVRAKHRRAVRIVGQVGQHSLL